MMNVNIRLSMPEDMPLLKNWLLNSGILQWFPMIDEREVDDAVSSISAYAKMGACLTAEIDGAVAGITNLYINPFQKLRHQCLFSIVVAPEFRGQGIGKQLLERLMQYAKEEFGIELLHLEVYAGNDAIRLYEKLGFKEYARHEHFIWHEGEYHAKIMMQKEL